VSRDAVQQIRQNEKLTCTKGVKLHSMNRQTDGYREKCLFIPSWQNGKLQNARTCSSLRSKGICRQMTIQKMATKSGQAGA